MSISNIKKRDGKTVKFEQDRITTAIHRALIATGTEDGKKSKNISDKVVKVLEERYDDKKVPSVEEIQDTVIEVLEKEGYRDIAEEYSSYRKRKTKIREIKEKLGIEAEPKLTVNSLEVLRKRYLLRDKNGKIAETPSEMFQRVSNKIASVDKKFGKNPNEGFKEFFKMMSKLEFLPNSPTLFNANAPLGQLSACFVLPVEDSLESIFSAVKKTAIIEQTGGGVGFDFSKLRPRGDIVKSTKGVASGPVSFMKVFDTVTEVIKAGGKRRGAMMGVLRVDHPDIQEFITAKLEEGPLSNFNISVAVTDDFMKAVEKGEKYSTVNPRTNSKGDDLDAREIWNKIAKSAWKCGDPGVLFLDEINRHNPTPEIEKIEATNPCITGDTLIETRQGLQTMKKLYESGQKVSVVVDGRFLENPKVKEASRVYKTGKKRVYRIKTKEGYELSLTPKHRIKTDDGWIEARNLVSGNKIHICDRKGEFGPKGSVEEGKVLGWLIGDGCFDHNDERAILYFYDEDRQLSEDFADYVNNVVRDPIHDRNYKIRVSCRTKHESRGPDAGREVIRSTRLYEFAEMHGLLEKKHQVPNCVFKGSEKMVRGFLQALFTADGSVQGNAEKGVSIRLSSSYLSFLKDTQKVLLNFGIPAKIYKNRRKRNFRELPNGKGGTENYECRAQHELIISKDNILRFQEEIGFLLEIKNRDLKKKIEDYKRGPYSEKFKATVQCIGFDGEKTVYDLKEPVTSSFVANGIVVHNCGEVPLLPNEPCNLGSVNLSRMTKKENGKVEVDWKKLKKTVKRAVHFLDNVIDANEYPFQEIEDMAKGNRKIGLGVMGWAELLIKMGIPYNSKKALKLADELMKFISETARNKSEEIGEARGSFPNFGKSIWRDNHEAMRNATVTSIAPTGSISIIAGCSSSIEPLFSVAFMRNVLEGSQLFEVNPLFEKIAKDRGFYSGDLMEKVAKKGSIQDIEEIPKDVKNIFVTALDIDPKFHVKMQATFQKHVDNAVSKTINLPKEATVEDIKEVYELAWKMDCKGITVYRYGSKSEQVLYTGTKEETSKFVSAESEYSGGGISGICPLCG